MSLAVVDLGSGFIKAGLQTDDAPTCVISSLVGRPRRRYTHLYDGNPVFVGEDAIENRHQLSFHYPIDHGHVDNFEDLEHLLNYTLTIGVPFEATDGSVLLTEPPFSSKLHREFLVQAIFEKFDVSEVNLSMQGALALYASGKTTGMVLEIGEGVTQIVPVNDGFTDYSAIRRSDFGGQELTAYLQELLCERGYPLTTRDEVEYVRIIKETFCYVATDPATEHERTDLKVAYTLPDDVTLSGGQTQIKLTKERFLCPELLFDPSLIFRDCPPLTELVWQSAQAVPIEFRKSCLSNVILSGGTSMFEGLKERLELELQGLVPQQTQSLVKVHADENRLFGVWLGARIFSDPALRNVQDMYWITREEWDEEGENVVERKRVLYN